MIETKEWVSDGTTRLFENSCPAGWTPTSSGGGVVGPMSPTTQQVQTTTTYVSCDKVGSGWFYTYSDETFEDSTTSQRLYWNDVPSDEVHEFYYIDLVAYGYMTLIQGEVLLHFDDSNRTDFEYGIDRYTHYERNQYNHNFPQNFTDFDTNYETQYNCNEVSANYFHKLARWNGDTYYFGNSKYLCDVPSQYQTQFPDGKSEVIYSSTGYRVDNELVIGTFNFDNGIIDHFTKDVFPYLVWGNSFTDSSTVRERYYWDQNSGILGDYYKYRGSTLYSKSTALFYIYPSNTAIEESQWYVDNMYDIND